MLNSLFIGLLLINSFNHPISNFDYQLSGIIGDFKNNLFDKDEIEDIGDEAEDLVDEIEDYIDDHKGELTSYEKGRIEEVLRNAEAVSSFIDAIGDHGGSHQCYLEDFYIAKKLIGGESSILSSTSDYCVQVIKYELNGYICHLLFNQSAQSYTVTYNWASNSSLSSGKSEFSLSSGEGECGLICKSIRPIVNNRDNENSKSIRVYDIGCDEIEFSYRCD